MIKICNKCEFQYEETKDPNYVIESKLWKTNGFINDFSVSGSYESTDLVDMHNYFFSICEKCIVEFFNSFKIHPKILSSEGAVSWEDDRKSMLEISFHTIGSPEMKKKKELKLCQERHDCQNKEEFVYYHSNSFIYKGICSFHKDELSKHEDYLFSTNLDLLKLSPPESLGNYWSPLYQKDLNKIAKDFLNLIADESYFQFIPGTLIHLVFLSEKDYLENEGYYYCKINSKRNLEHCYKQIEINNRIIYVFKRTKEELDKLMNFDFNWSLFENKDNIDSFRKQISKIDPHIIY